jgi:hypothetical protein
MCVETYSAAPAPPWPSKTPNRWDVPPAAPSFTAARSSFGGPRSWSGNIIIPERPRGLDLPPPITVAVQSGGGADSLAEESAAAWTGGVLAGAAATRSPLAAFLPFFGMLRLAAAACLQVAGEGRQVAEPLCS